jgi:hypothetical protein
MVTRLRRTTAALHEHQVTHLPARSAIGRGVLSVRADGGSRAREAIALQGLAGNHAVSEAIAGRSTAVGFGTCSTPDLQCTAKASRAHSKNLQVGAPSQKKDENDNVTYTVKGTISSNFTTTVNINLAAVPAGLSECAAGKLRDLINTKLKPHEDDHKARFLTSDPKHNWVGPFSKSVTKEGDDGASVQAEVKSELDSALSDEVSAREIRNDDYAINAIDPFNVTADISDCPECSSDE